MKKIEKRVTFRNGRVYIKDSNIRLDLVVGLGPKDLSESYPWLSEEQINGAIAFAQEIIIKRGRRETSAKQISAS